MLISSTVLFRMCCIGICTRHHAVESAECILLSGKTFWVLHCLIFSTDYSYVSTAYNVVNIRHSAVESAEYVRLSDKTLWVSQSLIYSTDCSIVSTVYFHGSNVGTLYTMTMQHTATHCNTLKHSATHLKTSDCVDCVFSHPFVPNVYSHALLCQMCILTPFCAKCVFLHPTQTVREQQRVLFCV